MKNSTSSLNRALGPVALTFYGVGTIIGAGIYAVIGAAAGEAGDGLWLSFVIAAIPALLAAFSYAELSTMMPSAGAEYVYIRKAIPKWSAGPFLVGFIVAAGSAGVCATVSLAFAGYLNLFTNTPTWIIALVLLAVCAAVNAAGIRHASWANITLTSVEVLGLLLIIGAGIVVPQIDLNLRFTPDWGVLGGAAIIFFVYTGFENIAKMAEETKKPSRSLPLALFVSLAVTTALYVAVAIAAGVLIEPSTLASSDAPLTTAGRAAAPWLGTALAWVALCSTANTAMLSLVAASRMLLSMGRDGDMPAALARVLPKRKSPWVAGLVMAGAAACLLPLGGLAVVASLSSFSVLLAFITVHVAMIVLRYRQPEVTRPFRVPLSIGRVPLIPLAGIASIIVLMAMFERTVYIAGTILVGVAFAVYWVRRLLKGRHVGVPARSEPAADDAPREDWRAAP